MQTSLKTSFKDFNRESHQDAISSVHKIAQVLGNFRAFFNPPQKHFWHLSLFPAVKGFTTTLMPVHGNGDLLNTELSINLLDSKIEMQSSNGLHQNFSCEDLSMREIDEKIRSYFKELGVDLSSMPEIAVNEDHNFDLDEKIPKLENQQLRTILSLYSLAQHILVKFKAKFRQESSFIRLWPGHFDLAFLWFSGKLIEGQDPNKPEYADEQAGFGFLLGDETIPEPYFYITLYPHRDELERKAKELNLGFQKEGFQGFVLKFSDFVNTENPEQVISDFLNKSFEIIEELCLS